MKEFLYEIAIGRKRGFVAEIIKALLLLLSLLYAVVVSVRVFLYKAGIIRSFKLPKPVISVGNITTGGVGKTPLVAYLASKIKAKGKRAVILTRGYMDQKGATSDEARWLQEQLGIPVLVGADRAGVAQEFLKRDSCDVFLLDDGFQHLRLKRDLDIVAIDTTNPWAGGHLLPRGFLREAVAALGRAQVIILTRADQGKAVAASIEESVRHVNPKTLILFARHQPLDCLDLRNNQTRPIDALKNKTICSFCSIGNPASFENTLRSLGAKVVMNLPFMDHHVYAAQDIQAINRLCEVNRIQTVVTTEKDRMKLENVLGSFSSDLQILSLRVTFALESNEDALLERIYHLL
ncbi:MAG TPA: tetraacyldisaccharide 4'-kinase [Candidatus Omnitrophota bacterium]|nr:tetraacyldisaccharide 4'-kinase [Candidatus Omnitrophota bacterium]